MDGDLLAAQHRDGHIQHHHPRLKPAQTNQENGRGSKQFGSNGKGMATSSTTTRASNLRTRVTRQQGVHQSCNGHGGWVGSTNTWRQQIRERQAGSKFELNHQASEPRKGLHSASDTPPSCTTATSNCSSLVHQRHGEVWVAQHSAAAHSRCVHARQCHVSTVARPRQAGRLAIHLNRPALVPILLHVVSWR